MNRQPEYHKQNREYRVIYRPHSQWVAQKLTANKPTRENDPWEDIGYPKQDKERALQVMYMHCPLKIKA